MTDLDITLLRHHFGLTRQQANFVAAVMDARLVATSDAVFVAICRDETNPPEEDILKVLACRARKKLAEHFEGDVIETVWGRGYQISAHMKEALRLRAGISQPMEQAA